MGEAFIGSSAGAVKIGYATYNNSTKVLQLPDGVTFGQVLSLSKAAIGLGNDLHAIEMQSIYADGRRHITYGYGGVSYWGGTTVQPTDTSVTLKWVYFHSGKTNIRCIWK